MEPSSEIVMGLEGGLFYGFGLWKMKFLIIPLIFAGFDILWVQEDERRARIANLVENKIMDAAGNEPVTARWKTST